MINTSPSDGSTLNWNFQEPVPNELIPHNTELDGEVLEAELGISSNGNDRFKLTVAALDENGNVVRNLYDYITMTEAAAWKMNEFIKATGLANQPGQVQLSEQALKGLKARINVVEDTYVDSNNKAQVTNKIGRWLSPKV